MTNNLANLGGSKIRSPRFAKLLEECARILLGVGFAFCLMGVLYMIYIAAVERAIVTIQASGARNLVVAGGMISITEGEVIHADDVHTIIQYYNEWDGAEYKKVIDHESADYPVNSKIPVVDMVGLCPGSCLVAGSCKKFMLFLSSAALIMFVFGLMILTFIKKGKEKWQGERL